MQAAGGLILSALFCPNESAGRRFVEFFTANIRNPNTRRAYGRAVVGFAAWCEQEAEISTLLSVPAQN